MAAGNRSVLVILDSRKQMARKDADLTVFAALDHFGVAWEVLDGGDYMGNPPHHIAPRAAYVLAHDGAGECLSDEVAREIVDALAAGAGLVSFDREIDSWPEPLRALVPGSTGSEVTGELRFAPEPCFITTGHQPDEDLTLREPLAVTTLPSADSWRRLLLTASGASAIACAEVGEGRAVIFGTGERIYDPEFLGHVCGLDGLMWRSLVWVAAKPFPMRCVPPFVSARMDDCHGTWSAFGYVDVMNRFGIAPNLGLFIDEMGPTDWAAAKRLHDSGGAEFAMHAFRDDFYKSRPGWKPFAVLNDKPDLSDGGRDTRFEGLSMDHETGENYDDATVERNFRRMDEAFDLAGIRHCRVLNSHFGEIGWRAVPHFLQRGVEFACNNAVAGQLYGNQPPWRPKPYSMRGATGRHGLVIDRCPHHTGLSFINMSVSHVGVTHMSGDILSGHVPFLGEADRPMIDEAIARGINNITLGLDALAFGILMTHEERIDVISMEDWERIVTGIVAGLGDYEVEFTGRDRISIICKRLFDSRLVRAEVTGTSLHCELCGTTDGPSPLTVWHNEGDGCTRQTVDLEAFDGFAATEVST